MTRQTFLVFTLALLLFAPATFAQSSTCDTAALLEAYIPAALAKEAKKDEDVAKAKLRVAAYDHVSGDWTAWEWKPDDKTTQPTLTRLTDEDDFELPHTNEPTLRVPKEHGVMVVAVNTIPSLYSTKLTASTESDIEGIADLQRLAGLFGNFVTTGVAARAAVAPSSAVMTAEGFTNSGVDTRSMSVTEKTEFFELAKSDIHRLGADLEAVISVLHPQAEALARANGALKDAAQTAGSATTALATLRDEAVVHLQLMESGTSAPSPLPSLQGLDRQLVTSLTQLRSARDAAVALPAACPAVIQHLDRALVWQIDGLPTQADPILRYPKEWDDAIEALQQPALTGKCPTELVQPLAGIGAWLEKNKPIAGGVTGELRTKFLQMHQHLFDFLNAHAQRETLTANATQMLSKRAAALKQATQLADLGRLVGEVFLQGACGLLRVQRVEGRDLNLPFTKIRNEEFSINIRPAFASEIERRRADVAAAKYHLTRRDWDFDVDTAVVYTDIQNAEYHVVDTDPDEEAATFVVAEKARETRAGDLALLLTAKPYAAKGFGAQLGFGFDTASPSIYLGLGYAFGDYIKLSGGRTWQRVTKLGEGYALGGTVNSATDLATREGYDNDWYLALSVTLDNLPFFKQPE